MQFATGFISNDHFQYAKSSFRGRNWNIRLGPQISGQTACGTFDGKRVYRSREVFVNAKSEAIARQVVSDIVGGITLLQGSSVLISELYESTENDDNPNAKVKQLHASYWCIPGIPVACTIAARVSQNRRLQYALAKYKLSSEMASFAGIDLDPNYSQTIPRWNKSEDHVRLAMAVVLAYSVIEELGLEIRASQKSPSAINAQWNPVVKTELEERLKRAKIDISQPIVWSYRGGKSILEIECPKHLFETSKQTPWTQWKVRDQYVELVDAIGHASFLRSKVSSHRLKPTFVRMLSAYEVSNVQHLARRLFLEALGYWPPHKMQKRKNRDARR